MILIDCESNKASFYFALEEFIMCEMRPNDSVLMIWKTADTAMIGANQIVSLEIDTEYAEKNDIAITRRASGGGTIFTDPGTLLYTIIIPYKEDVDPKEIVEQYLAKPVISALSKIGVEAGLEGRNDILIKGKKFSGIAQHIRRGYLCSHGSLLFNADLEKLVELLNVDAEKIISKDIRSVSSRVVNISECLSEANQNIDITAFKQLLIESFGEHREMIPYQLSPEEFAKIESIINNKYENPDWTYGHNSNYSFSKSKRFKEGKIEAFLTIEEDYIKGIKITGDFLSLKPIAELEEIIDGTKYNSNEMISKLKGINLSDYIGKISLEEFISVLL